MLGSKWARAAGRTTGARGRGCRGPRHGFLLGTVTWSSWREQLGSGWGREAQAAVNKSTDSLPGRSQDWVPEVWAQRGSAGMGETQPLGWRLPKCQGTWFCTGSSWPGGGSHGNAATATKRGSFRHRSQLTAGTDHVSHPPIYPHLPSETWGDAGRGRPGERNRIEMQTSCGCVPRRRQLRAGSLGGRLLTAWGEGP